MDSFSRFWYFIRERHSIYLRRKAGKPKPWTKDKILQQYRFCNVYRELDTVTKWIASNWRLPNTTEKDLWFAMVVARYLNYVPTLDDLGFPVPWDAEHFKKVLTLRKEAGDQVFTGVYIIHSRGPKRDYIADRVLTPLWKYRKEVRPQKTDTLESFYNRLRTYNGMGSFMAGQVVADIKHNKPLNSAKDFLTFAASGPGSKRGLNLLLGKEVDSSWSESEWYFELMQLKSRIDLCIAQVKMPILDAQNLQNCLCEFSKYEKTRRGLGRPRNKYPGL